MSDVTDKELSQEKGSAPTEKREDDEISLLDLVAIMWKHKKLIAGVTVVAMIGVLLYAIISLKLPPEKSYLPNVYTSKATLLVPTSGSGSLSSALAASGLSSYASLAGISTGGNTNGQLAQTLATSNPVLDAVNQKYQLTERYKVKGPSVTTDTREAIKKHLSAKFDEKTNLFTVSYEDRDPVLAKNVVDTVVQELVDRFSTLGGDKAIQQKDLLEKKLADVNGAINDLQAQVKAFQTKYGVMEVDALASEQITILARLRSELILKEMDISNYEKVSKINDPVMTQLKNERDELLAKIKEIESGKGSGSRVMPSQKEMPDIAFEYAKLERDLAVQTELFKLLTQQYELAKLNASGQDPAFQILEMAEVPDKKSGPSRGMICVVTTLAAFLIAILAAFIEESIEKTQGNPETVARFKALSTPKAKMPKARGK
jgi:tyrosine-protein kinase Etk/Wzc